MNRGRPSGGGTFGGAPMAFGNRAEESLVRLSQAREAPNRVKWGEFDRSALVRLPVVATDDDRRPVSPPTVEFRLPDGSAYPHLLLAGVAQAMLKGRATEDLDALLESTRRLEGRQRGVFPLVLLDARIERLKRR